MKHFILEKSKRIWVPPSGRKKGYWRTDPREKGLFDLLKDILDKIRGLKKQGKFTDEQRRHIRKTLKELEPRFKHFKTQQQRIAVSKVLKEIRAELKDLDKPKKTSGALSSSELKEMKARGFTPDEIKKLGPASARAVIWNDIPRDEALK